MRLLEIKTILTDFTFALQKGRIRYKKSIL